MRPRAFAGWVLLGVLLLQSAWVFTLPPFRGSDEIDHAFRAAAVAHGQWDPGPYALNGKGRLIAVPADIVDAAHAQCLSLDYYLADNCEPVRTLADGRVEVASGAAVYEPAFYWVVGLPSLFLEGDAALYGMRVVASLGCAALIAAAAWCLATAVRSMRWRLVGLLLALSPVALFSTTLPAANGVEICSALLLWSALLAIGRRFPDHDSRGDRHSRCLVALAVVAGVVLAGARGLGPGFLVIIVSVNLLLNPAALRRALSAHRTLAAIGTVGTVAAVAAPRLWYASLAASTSVHDNVNGDWTWGSPVLWQLQMIAAFPFRNNAAPVYVYFVFGALFVWVVIAAFRHANRWDRRVLALLVAGVLAMPLALTALTYSSSGLIWQGRYGLAVGMGIPLLAVTILDDWNPRWLSRSTPIMVAVLGLLEAAAILKVDRDQAKRSLTMEAGFDGPPTWLILLLVAGSTACFIAAHSGARSPEGERRNRR